MIPEASIDDNVMTVPGTDGQKMSKSYGNIIDIFLPDKQLRKNVMGIITDSTPMEEPKNPDTCNVFNIYKLLGTDEQITKMRQNYLGGNYGYGDAKQELFELLIDKFSVERERYNYYMKNLNEIDKALAIGAAKAKAVADKVLDRVRTKVGY